MKITDGSFLVTGGAGFVGSHLVDALLSRGARRVVIFDNFIRSHKANIEAALRDCRVELFGLKGDIRNEDEILAATDGIDGAFHLAALSLLHCDMFPRAALNVNVIGSFNVFDACRINRVKRLVHASSSSVYGDAVYVPMDEQHPFNNKHFYGASKIATEALLTAFHEKYQLEFVALRYMNVYGPRQDSEGAYVGAVVTITDKVLTGESPVLYGDGSQSYDFVYVDDVVRATVAAMESDVANDVFNVGTGVKTSMLQLTELIMSVIGTRLPVSFEPLGRSFVVNRVGSIHKAARLLGFQPSVALKDGLERVVRWRASELVGAADAAAVRRTPAVHPSVGCS